jgi:hypothetical protein
MDKNSNNDLQISIQKLKIVQGEHLKTVGELKCSGPAPQVQLSC